MHAVRAASDANTPRFFVINQWLPPDSAPTAVLAGEVIDLLLSHSQNVMLISRARSAQAALADREGLRHFVTDCVEAGPLGVVGKLRAWPGFAWACYRILRRELRSGDCLIVCSDPPLFYPIAVFAARQRGVRLIHWSQDVYPDIVEQHSRWPGLMRVLLSPLRWIRRRALRHIDRTVVLSEGMQARMHAAGANTQIIANWARDDRIAARAPRDSALRRAHFSDQDFVIAYSGNLGRVHEFETLIVAAERLRGESGIRFLIVGNGPRLASLKQAVAEAQLSSFVFLPLQPEAQLADSLAAGDAHFVSLQPQFEGLVLPSKLYGICTIGRAVVFCGDANGEVARFVRQQGFGVAAPVDDGVSLAEAIRQLAADRSRCDQMGATARVVLDQSHSRKRALEQWQALLLPQAQRLS